MNPSTCATYFHDFIAFDATDKRDTLNRDLLALVCALPNSAATTPPRNVFEFALDYQLRGWYRPVST